jgi:hypothetical protein
MKFPKTIVLIASLLVIASTTGLTAAPKGGDDAKSFILMEGADFWTLKGDRMEWVEKLSLAQTVEASSSTAKGKYKSSKDTVDREYNLVKVELDSGKSGYVIEYFVARDAIMGVVTQDLATLYSDARDAAVLQTILPVSNIVALWPVSGKPDFYKVAGWEEVKGFSFKDRFVSTSDVSVQETDINVALLLKAMAGMKKPEQKKKILNTIDTKYPNSAFTGLVESARQNIDAQPAAAAASTSSTSTSSSSSSVSTQKAVQYWVANAPLNIRKEPNTGAEVVMVLNKGDYCSTSEYTNDSFTVGDKTGRWYKTTQPVIGWAFGAFLEAAAQN